MSDDAPRPLDDHFFQLSVDLLCVAGLDGYFKRLNPAWETTLGFSIEELLSRPMVEFIHPDDRAATRELAAPLLRGEPLARFENRYLCKDGSFRWISWTSSAVRSGDPCLYAAGRDVTEQRLAQQALDRKTAELEAVFSALPDLLFRTDAGGRIIGYNAGRASDLYVSPDAFLGKSFADVLPTEVGAALTSAIERAHRGSEITSLEYTLAVPAGERWFEARVVPLPDGQTITVVRNVTEQRLTQEGLSRSEERLREAEKVEVIGRLAGGIAHDFNNLMMVVLTYTEVLLRRLPPDDLQRRHLLEIRGAGERATRLTRQLLAFARRQLLQPTVFDPGEVVREMERMLGGVIGEHIVLSSACAPGLWTVRVDRNQLEQVVLNLALNARDAMPGGGNLTIDVANAEIDAAAAQRLGLPAPGDYVRLSVTDTGCGIEPSALPHVFEPFFTTKHAGSGTGLGLATVYGVVAQSGGAVSVDTAPGRGATFTILLPRAEDKPERVTPPEQVEPRPGEETILIVEDEAAVRRALTETLRPLGYEVLEAENAAAAIRIVEERGAVDLLLTDVVMPGLNGYELAAKLREKHGELQVLFMSGYASNTTGPAGAGSAGPLLQKPFTPNTLAIRVRDLLDAGARAGVARRPRVDPS